MTRVRDTLNRKLLAEMYPGNPRIVMAMEAQAKAVDDATDGLSTQAEATDLMQDASVIVLASNQAFTGERELELGQGLSGEDTGSKLLLQTSSKVPLVSGDFTLIFTLAGNTTVAVPLTGILATVGNVETLTNKTLSAPKLSGLGNYADDAAAATGGVPIGGIYHSSGALRVRLA